MFPSQFKASIKIGLKQKKRTIESNRQAWPIGQICRSVVVLPASAVELWRQQNSFNFTVLIQN